MSLVVGVECGPRETDPLCGFVVGDEPVDSRWADTRGIGHVRSCGKKLVDLQVELLYHFHCMHTVLQ